jgi:hypothetical protein
MVPPSALASLPSHRSADLSALDLNRKQVGRSLLVLAHATWITFAAQVITMMMFIAGLKAAGAFHPETPAMFYHCLPVPVVWLSQQTFVLAYLVWVYLQQNRRTPAHITNESHIS